MSVAIVGSGLAGFTAYQVLRRGGLEPGEIAVFGTEDDPASVWRRRAAAIRQREMRSESDGHCRPTTFPGLAFSSVRRRRSLRPLVESACDRYHPTVEEFLSHVEGRRERSGWDKACGKARVGRIARGGRRLRARRHGGFAHVLVAPGHPGLNVPDELRDDPRAVHAYEPHEYASTVTVVGAGLAAATEWLNALAAGAEVVSVRRREPLRTPLNVPREYFSRAGSPASTGSRRGSAPRACASCSRRRIRRGGSFDEPLERAAREGRFRVEQSVNGSAQVICATGFLRGFAHDPLLARARRRARARDGRRLDRARRRTRRSPALTDETRTLALAGAARAVGVSRGRHARRRALRRATDSSERIKACRTR